MTTLWAFFLLHFIPSSLFSLYFRHPWAIGSRIQKRFYIHLQLFNWTPGLKGPRVNYSRVILLPLTQTITSNYFHLYSVFFSYFSYGLIALLSSQACSLSAITTSLSFCYSRQLLEVRLRIRSLMNS